MFLHNPLIYWVAAILVTVALFYGLDHFVMSSQGLPLNFDLTPVSG